MRGGFAVRSTTVDSIPTWDWPPSTINRILPPRTFADVRGVGGGHRVGQIGAGRREWKTTFTNDGLDERMGRPADPTVGPPAVTMPGISPERGSTSVSGPGQNDRASLSASGGQAAAHRRAISRLAHGR